MYWPIRGRDRSYTHSHSGRQSGNHMSDIRADLIRNSSGNGPINLSWPRASDGKMVGQSAAKAWAYGDLTAETLGSFNLSSGTDHGPGDYTYPLIVHMADLYYSQSASVVTGNSDRTAIRNIAKHEVGIVAVLTNNARLSTNTDQNHNVAINGDLA